MFRMSDGRYWARRSQHERMRPTEGNVEKREQKNLCQRTMQEILSTVFHETVFSKLSHDSPRFKGCTRLEVRDLLAQVFIDFTRRKAIHDNVGRNV